MPAARLDETELTGIVAETENDRQAAQFFVLGPSSLSRLVTQTYFPGEWLSAHDRLIGSIADTAAQSRLVADPVPTEQIDGEWLDFRHSLILRGRYATPALP